MARLTDRQIAWWNAQPDAQVCRDCGKAGVKAYIQPQPDGKGALCTDCINAINERIRADRKAALQAAPRCEIPGCKRRGSFLLGSSSAPRLGCCGHHKKAIEAEYYKRYCVGNPFALFLPAPRLSREELLNLYATRNA